MIKDENKIMTDKIFNPKKDLPRSPLTHNTSFSLAPLLNEIFFFNTH